MNLTTHNNITIPAFMYGTAWKKGETARLVELAVDAGFKAIDTANQLIHYNEALVGDALLSLQKKGVQRKDLFLQTKFTSVDGQGGQQPYDARADLTTQVKQSVDSSLKHLHTDWIDSYVLHGPYSRYGLDERDWEVWSAMEEFYQGGTVKMIGISNVNADQLSDLCNEAKVKPMVVQNRCYAVRGWDMDVREICRQHNIIYQGFSLLTANPNVLSDPAVQAIAKRVNATVTQVIFRFAQQVGMLPLTGTTNAKHMKDDLEAQNLQLQPEDVKLIETIGLAARY